MGTGLRKLIKRARNYSSIPQIDNSQLQENQKKDCYHKIYNLIINVNNEPDVSKIPKPFRGFRIEELEERIAP